jgi:hypothetical protein
VDLLKLKTLTFRPTQFLRAAKDISAGTLLNTDAFPATVHPPHLERKRARVAALLNTPPSPKADPERSTTPVEAPPGNDAAVSAAAVSEENSSPAPDDNDNDNDNDNESGK